MLAALVVLAGSLAVLGAEDPPPDRAPTVPLRAPLLAARRVAALIAQEIAAERLGTKLDALLADPSLGGARQQQVRQIGTSDDQNQADD